MKANTPLTRFILSAFLLSAAGICAAQGPPGQDPYNPPPGHGGVPPGQAKKYREDYHFRGDDRGRFYTHYRSDADQWRYRRRPVFVTGRVVPREYVIQAVPQSYWVSEPPPPPGYQYGYYGGYVVAYNPTTRIVADVLDLVAAATAR
jgi:hypothetical protein